MPREIIHWGVLESATQQLAQSGAERVVRCLSDHSAAAYLGAIAHDAPYYCKGGRDEEFAMVSEYLHGAFGDDTFEPLRALYLALQQREEERERNMLLAFLLGMLSHCAVDIQFHPIIYYLTGNYYAMDSRERVVARTNHRLFETYLDEAYRERITLWNHGLVRAILAELGKDLDLICGLLGENLPARIDDTSEEKTSDSEGPGSSKWKRSFMDLSRIQRAFLSVPFGVLIRTVRSLGSMELRCIDALFAYGREGRDPYFDEEHEYLNPLSGSKTVVGFDELFAASVEQCFGWFQLVENFLQSRQSGEILSQNPGLSLNVGVHKVKFSEYKHFSSEPPPLRDMVR